jgi:DnaJ-class molecular chaperone
MGKKNTHNTGDEDETSSDDDCIACHGTGWKEDTEEDCPACNGKGR